MIAIHAERVTNDPAAVRWVMPAGLVDSGRVRSAPGALGEMFASGTLTAGLVEPTAIWLWLRDDLSWRQHGGPVDRALREALDGQDGWDIEPAPGDVLERVTTDLLDGTVGDFLRSHGGTATAQRLDDDAIEVQLGGACEHCSAAGHTLRLRLLGELRQRCPDLIELDGEQPADGRLTVSLTPVSS